MRNRIKTPKRRGMLAKVRAAFFLAMSGLSYRVMPDITSRWLRRWFFATSPYRLSAAQQQLQAQARCGHIDNKFNKINILEWGEGPVILLVHGWNGRALQMNTFVEPLLAQGYKVVAFDHKGHGESAFRFSSFLEMVQGTQQMMAHYAHALEGVVAHSIGCNAVLKASEASSQKLNIVLVAPVDDFLSWLEKVRMRFGIDAGLFANVIGAIEADTGLKLAEQCTLDYANIGRHAVMLVHDKFDRINKIDGSYKLRDKLPGTALLQTEALGHARILANTAVVERTVSHLVNRL